MILSASLAGFMSLLDGNIVNISLPYIARSFNVGTGSVVQLVLVYMLVLVGTMIIFGKLADQYGVRKIFISGFVTFTLFSLLCGLSTTLPMLVLFRSAQAIGASMLMATAVSLIPKFIPKDRLGWAFGIFSPVVSLGLLVGNPLGGLITGLLNWHWIFLINVPVGIIAVISATRSIPDDRPEGSASQKKGRFDFEGSVLSFTGLALLVFCLNTGPKLGWTNVYILGGIVLAILLLVAFVFVEKRSVNPILDMGIFSDRNFSLSLLASFAGFGLMAGSSVMMPFYLTYILKIDVEHAGFILMTFAVIFSALSPMSGNLSDHYRKTRLSSGGMMLAILACLFFILCLPLAKLWIVFTMLVLLGIGYAFFITPNNNLVMSLADTEKQSISASVFKLSTNLGQMIGVLFMEIMFVLSMPAGFHADGSMVHKLQVSTLTEGFQWAYGGGLLLCLVSLALMLVIKERPGKTNVPDEPATLL